MCMVSKSLDVYVLLKLSLWEEFISYDQLAKELSMSSSEAHASVQRSIKARLINPQSRLPVKNAFEDYLFHGVPYAFPAELGNVSRGVPTAYAAPPLFDLIAFSDLPPVWMWGEGSVKGRCIEPLHRFARLMAAADPKFYEILALVDAVRMGRRREILIAEAELRKRLFNAAG